MSKEEEEKAKL